MYGTYWTMAVAEQADRRLGLGFAQVVGELLDVRGTRWTVTILSRQGPAAPGLTSTNSSPPAHEGICPAHRLLAFESIHLRVAQLEAEPLVKPVRCLPCRP